MKSKEEENDIIEELERMDRFFDGTEPGELPIDVLRSKGIEIPDETTLDDAQLHERLWAVICGMAEIGMYVDSTDHLSERELYRILVNEALAEETMLPLDKWSAWHWSPIGGFSEEDTEIYLRYYADDDIRARFAADGDAIPPKETPPYDRDRLLPRHHPFADDQPQG